MGAKQLILLELITDMEGEIKMAAKLITMLTHNDVTSPDSMDIFMKAKEAPCEYWGFKDVGVTEDEMKRLVYTMKEYGKTVFMESLAFGYDATMKSTELAVRIGVDYLLGGTYYRSIGEFAADNGLRISPFIGLRHDGHLYGDLDELVAEAIERDKGLVYGINITAYRYDGNSGDLIKRVVASCQKPVSIAGSINSNERLKAVKSTNCWAFTIGGAFFENKFGEGFAEQIENVVNFLER